MRSYKYRIYPSNKQVKRLENNLNLCEEMYNILLQRHIYVYKTNGRSLNKYHMTDIIKELKDSDSRFKNVHSQALQNTADRLAKAFANFFRRCKEKKAGKNIKVGFPRFKTFYKSITYPQSGFKIISDKKIFASQIGNIPIVLHRVPKGIMKTMTIKRTRSNKWFIFFSCEISDVIPTHPFKNNQVGIDVGLTEYGYLSDETVIANPRTLIHSEDKLALVQKRLSRKKKGSANRRKARLPVSRCHERIQNQRMDFLNKASRAIVNKYGFIAVENLNIANMVHNHHLAKHISDASWGTFLRLLDYKASSAGGQVFPVNPSGTTQLCSGCNSRVPKDLSVRIHSCTNCGLNLHRDHNSALNILNRALEQINNNTVGLTEIHACGNLTSTVSVMDTASQVNETGTIHNL